MNLLSVFFASTVLAMGSQPKSPLLTPDAIVPSSMCLSLLVRDGLGIPTVKANHQPAAVKISLPRRLERLSYTELTKLGLPPGVFLDQARLAPYTAGSGGLMPLRSTRDVSSLNTMVAGSSAETAFLAQLSELLSRQYAVSMGSASFLGQGLTVSPVINTFSGNLFVCSLDAAALWKGLNVMLYRVYNGLMRGPGPFGPGWTHNFAARLDFQEEGAIQYTRWDGSHFCYKPKDGGGWKSPEGFDDALTRSGTGYQIKDLTGLYLLFDSTGRLSEIGNRLGYRLVCQYEGDRLMSVRNMGQVISLTANQDAAQLVQGGPGIMFSYDEHGKITSVRSTSGAQVSYVYDEVGRIAKVTSNSQQAVAYRYDGQGRLGEVRDGVGGERGTLIAGIFYDESDRISEITDSAGTAMMKLNYRWGIDRTTQVILGVQKQLITDRYDERGVLIERVGVDQTMDPTAQSGASSSRQTRECDDHLNVTSMTKGGGVSTRWMYDSSGNITRASDSDGTWVEMRYQQDSSLIEYISESHGRWIRFVYALDGTISEIVLDDGNHYKVDYDDGGVPRNLIAPGGATKPLDLGLPPEIPRQLWEF